MISNLFKSKKKEPEIKIKLSYDRSMPLTKKNIINYLRSSGIDVHTDTKARGNNGIYFQNRIDIAKNLKEDKAVEVLIHEYAHYIHSLLEKNFAKNGGSLKVLFDTKEPDKIKQELEDVACFVDENSKAEVFKAAKEETSNKIKSMQRAIQQDYPNFLRSKRFVEFDKYVKNSDAKYLVRYDAVRIKKGLFIKKDLVLSVKNIETDFPQMPKAFQTYIKLCSLKRKQSKISRRINKMKKYYGKPTELFARFVQGFVLQKEEIKAIAPITSNHFDLLLKNGYYKELKDFFEVFGIL